MAENPPECRFKLGDVVRWDPEGKTGVVSKIAEGYIWVDFGWGKGENAAPFGARFLKFPHERRYVPAWMRKPQRYAGAYGLRDRIVIHAHAQIVGGPGRISEPFFSNEASTSNESLGESVRMALTEYREITECPTREESDLSWKSFLKACGVRSHRQLQENATCCAITEYSDTLEFEPQHNGGMKGNSKWFQPIEDQEVVIPVDASLSEVGNALVLGVSRCTTIYELPA